MNAAEQVLASRLLRMASEEFGNHGCNDTDAALFKDFSQEDRKGLEYWWNTWNAGTLPRDPDQWVPFEQIQDWAWMSYLADQVQTRCG